MGGEKKINWYGFLKIVVDKIIFQSRKIYGSEWQRNCRRLGEHHPWLDRPFSIKCIWIIKGFGGKTGKGRGKRVWHFPLICEMYNLIAVGTLDLNCTVLLNSFAQCSFEHERTNGRSNPSSCLPMNIHHLGQGVISIELCTHCLQPWRRAVHIPFF